MQGGRGLIKRWRAAHTVPSREVIFFLNCILPRHGDLRNPCVKSLPSVLYKGDTMNCPTCDRAMKKAKVYGHLWYCGWCCKLRGMP